MNPVELAAVLVSGAAAGGLVAWIISSNRLKRVAELESVMLAALRGEYGQRALAKAAKAVLRRPRRRYIVFEVVPAGAGREEVERAIEDAARAVLGLVGLADSAVKLVDYDESTGRGIVRVRHTYKYVALAVLGLVRSINGRPAMIVPIATSGTIRRARRLMSTS